MNKRCDCSACTATHVLNLARHIVINGDILAADVLQAEIADLAEALDQAEQSYDAAYHQLVKAKPDNQIIRCGGESGVLAHQVAIRLADRVLLEASFHKPNWASIAMGDENELADLIRLERDRASLDHEQASRTKPNETAAAEAMAGENHADVSAIAGKRDLSLDEKMIRIAVIHPAAVHWRSNQWGALFDVTPSRIRQTSTWQKWRGAERKPD